ncbi:hypothetical protein JYU34_013787 [Plutella xylostella]|uniref:IkappaB kinase n=1 Tax=Plutella xylostella TaxID=51655 RepID=A0ABQ7QAM9_PLUXY|nr:hypothetical protein JYU34_013787 [Plutella xylostella]
MDDIVFVGDWVKDRVLGSGSFGIVILWKHKRTDEKLAIKTCKWGNELTDKHKERWTKEVEMLQTCDNPNIVGTRELPPEFKTGLARANPSGLPILCMEYCSGGDLRQLLNKPESCAGLKELQIRQILSDIKSAMQFLYQNKITHRDLKPENIVMQNIDNVGRSEIGSQSQSKVLFKLIDLGYAKEIDSNSVCASFVGTLQYLAPELFYSKTYSNSVDFWSFGLLAFEILCGVRPFLPNMPPVQWMPHIKKKAHENICVYETHHGDIEYSDEIFPENYISKPFKALLEKWFRVALEWDPKLRGRDAPSKVTFNLPTEEKGEASKVILFSMLESILAKKIIKIFCVYNLSFIAYEIDDNTSIATLKSWIQKDTQIKVSEQILISRMTNLEIDNEDMVARYWNDQGNTMLYLYNKTQIIHDNVEILVPKAVQRSLEHPKALYNYNNSQNLYRSGFYFVISQMEIYDAFITGLFVRAESLKQESKQLLLKHNNVDKVIGKLLTKQETVEKMIDTGKKHIEQLKENRTGTNFLGGFEKIFKEADELFEKINKIQTAWSQLTIRLQSAARRSNEILLGDLNNFVSKYNYQSLYVATQKCYIFYRKNEREYRIKERPCHEIMKICYDCLKLRSKMLLEIKNQAFLLKLMDLSVEFSKISDIITTASENMDKLGADLSSSTDELTNCLWSTISVLSSDAENMTDLPYSVVSFQKRDFKIGDAVTNHKHKNTNGLNEDDEVRLLVEESLKLRLSQSQLTDKINLQKKMLNESITHFGF